MNGDLRLSPSSQVQKSNSHEQDMDSRSSTGNIPRSQGQGKKEDLTKAVVKQDKEVLLIVFIHGFKGTDETFGEFPGRLQHILSEAISNIQVESILFPAYETKGKLDEAVVRFADWLTTLTVEREVASGGGAGSAKIVLCGHSMGGLLAADTLREFVTTRPDATCPLWPKIIGCIAFDTPFLGIHPFVVKHSVTKATEYATAAKTVGSAILGSFAGFTAKKATTPTSPTTQSKTPQTAWSKWASPAAFAVGGAILAGAAAGGAYYNRDDLGQGYTWATDHMKYVGTLWDETALNRRIEDLIDIEEREGVTFRIFYTILPPTPPVYLTPRTFVVLPKRSTRLFTYFLPSSNGIAPDELQAHTGMFGARSNDGYYELGLATAKLIREAVMLGRGVFEHDENMDKEASRNPMTATTLPKESVDSP